MKSVIFVCIIIKKYCLSELQVSSTIGKLKQKVWFKSEKCIDFWLHILIGGKEEIEMTNIKTFQCADNWHVYDYILVGIYVTQKKNTVCKGVKNRGKYYL